MAREIELTKGAVAVVDDEDYPWLSRYSWHLTSAGYAARRSGDHIVLMHREILGAEPEEKVDHRDRDRLNNRRSNLRVATYTQNSANTGKRGGTTSRYKGVCRAEYNPSKPWRAYIDIYKQRRYLGYYRTEEEAAQAYDEAAQREFGEFACLNFPAEEVETYVQW